MKGILFSERLFPLVLDGSKTQTRRLVKSKTGYFNVQSKDGIITGIWQTDANGWEGENLIPVKPRYKIGEKVYLKEPYIDDTNMEFTAFPIRETLTHNIDGDILYMYVGAEEGLTALYSVYGDVKWRNKFFMPASAARYFIEITGVRAERLQDISEEDCMKEGIKKMTTIYPVDYMSQKSHDKTYYSNGDGEIFGSPRSAYAALIEPTCSFATWESNPFVWVYDFKLTAK